MDDAYSIGAEIRYVRVLHLLLGLIAAYLLYVTIINRLDFSIGSKVLSCFLLLPWIPHLYSRCLYRTLSIPIFILAVNYFTKIFEKNKKNYRYFILSGIFLGLTLAVDPTLFFIYIPLSFFVILSRDFVVMKKYLITLILSVVVFFINYSPNALFFKVHDSSSSINLEAAFLAILPIYNSYNWLIISLFAALFFMNNEKNSKNGFYSISINIYFCFLFLEI